VRGSGLAAEVEARYLAGSGVGHLLVSDSAVARSAKEVDASLDVVIEPSLTSTSIADPEWAGSFCAPARDVALGAYRALSSLRRVLHPTKEPP
jgi:hypothetical protein